MRPLANVMLVLLAICTARVGAQTGVPLPRITVRGGVFMDTATNKPFLIRGFNYLRLRPNPKSAVYPLHDTFNPQRYDSARVEKAFVDLQANGYNVVRVFIDPAAGPGIVATSESAGFSPAYMNNVFDFLERARRHHIYVYIEMSWTPGCTYFDQIVGQVPPDIFWANAWYLYPPLAQAKAEYLTEFVSAIKARHPELLTTVFAYEAENELNLVSNQPPPLHATHVPVRRTNF